MAKSTGFLGKQHADKTRQKIQVTQIVNRLNKFALGQLGDEEVTAGQLRAAEVLLRKALPDLSSVQMVAEVTAKRAEELSDADLLNIAAAGSAGTAKAQNSQGKTSSVH